MLWLIADAHMTEKGDVNVRQNVLVKSPKYLGMLVEYGLRRLPRHQIRMPGILTWVISTDVFRNHWDSIHLIFRINTPDLVIYA